MEVIVSCGNGGDWEWYNDQYLWQLWIEQNITTEFNTGSGIHVKADELAVRFKNPSHATIFTLKRPMWITHHDVILPKPVD